MPRRVPETDGTWRIRRGSDDAAQYRQNGWWRDCTHLDEFLERVRSHPDKVAIVAYADERPLPRKLTYAELGRYVDLCAAKLIELGIGPGDVVSLQLPNSWEFPILALATMRAGGIPNPIPVIYRELEVSFIVRHAKSKVLVIPDEFRGYRHVDLGRKLRMEVSTLGHVVCVGARTDGLLHFESEFLGADPDEARAARSWRWPWSRGEERSARATTGKRQEFSLRRPKADDIAVLLFTSGTTGTPKAAAHTYNTIWSAGRPVPASLSLTPDDVCFMASTMGHLTGFYWGMLLPLSLGQKVVYQDAWNATRLLEAIDEEGITWTLSATPFALDLIDAQKKAKRKISSFRAFVCGGASIPPTVAIALQEHLGVDLISLWGCTEVGICTIHKLGAPVDVLANSDGIPVEWIELRIVDEHQNPVDLGQEGRLQVRGPSVFEGYLNQPELTRQMQLSDGWCDTGDLGRATEDGGVRITGRSKDIIIRGGQNVPVVEIENELIKHARIKEVVVVGIPDPRLGERGCAVVVPDGEAPTLDDVRRQLEQAGMAKQFWPEYLEIVEAMPRTPAGKVQKYVLRERLAARDWTHSQGA